MDRKWKIAVVLLLLVTFMAIPFTGCAKEKTEEGVVPIVIGCLADFTGPAAAGLKPYAWATADLARYVNENDPIEGVRIKVISYDTKHDPARYQPGYDYLMQNGAQIVYSSSATMAEGVRAFAEGDGVPLITGVATKPLIDPPGWTFCFLPTLYDSSRALMRWVEQDMVTKGIQKAKIGSVGWNYASGNEQAQGVREYCTANPGKFDYVGDSMSTVGTVSWTGPAQQMKGCDYINICAYGAGAATLMSDFYSQGYTGSFINTIMNPAYQSTLLGKLGAQQLNGFAAAIYGWWADGTPLTELAKSVLQEYRPEEYSSQIATGNGYLSGFAQTYFFFGLLRSAVESVGAENFDAQVFRNTAESYSTTEEGYEEWGFDANTRYAMKSLQVWQFQDAAGDYVRISDWISTEE